MGLKDTREPDEEFADRLFDIVERDDLKSFDDCMQSFACGALSLGRFPVLSVAYLYSARSIIRAYEKQFIATTSWKRLKEPAALSSRFLKEAGKCMRLYLDEVVSPLEMLLILGDLPRFKKLYRLTRTSAAVKGRLSNIYSINYSLNLTFDGETVVADRLPRSAKQKKIIIAACAGAAFCIAAGVAIPFIVDQFNPFIVYSDGTYHVSRWEAVDAEADKSYTLTRSLTIPKDFYVERLTCNIFGNGNALYFDGDACAADVLSGDIAGVKFVSSGKSAIFNAVDTIGKIKDCELEVSCDITVDQGFAFLAYGNYGVIENVSATVSGKVFASQPAETAVQSVKLGGLVIENAAYGLYTGLIKDCSVRFDGFKLEGEVKADASFGGIAGENSGQIYDCRTYGRIEADTVDLAGICSLNYDEIVRCVNGADIVQTTSSNKWSPIAAGIAATNCYLVSYCENTAEVSCTNTCSEPDENGYPDLYAAGIVAKNVIAVNAFGQPVSLGVADRCVCSGKIAAKGAADMKKIAGGIAALMGEGLYFAGTVNEGYYGGNVTNSFFTGTVDAEGSFSGAIVGCMGAHLVERSLKGNYYSDDCNKSLGVGTTISQDEEGEPVFGEGSNAECNRVSKSELSSVQEYVAIRNELDK